MKPQEFARPGPGYGGTTLWMLNDRLEENELRRQLRGLRDAGWSAVIDRTFNGLRTPYLSAEWHRLIRATIDEAKKLGLKVWLQAGYMPGGIPELPEESRQQVLVRRPPGTPQAPGDAPLATRDGWTYCTRREAHVVDLLSRKACAEYVRLSYTECLERHYGDELGRTVETIWVDEPHFHAPELPWSPELPERFRARWGYDPLPEIDTLFVEHRDFLRTRHHFWRTVTEMLLEAYFAQIRAWCEGHGVAFGGHLMGEDTLQAQISWTGACMPCYEHMGIPGIDHLTRSLRWPAERPFILTPKQCSSVANQLGKPRTLAEMYGVSSQGLDFEDRKRIGDWLLMLGVNERCCHGSFYSLRGRRKRIYAPHLSHQQPWWPDNRVVADYFSRFCYLMRQGSYVADVLILHPVESAWCRYEVSDASDPHERVREPGAVRAMTDSLIELSENLLRIHRGFDYGDEGMLERFGSVAADRLRVGAMSYRAVILPELVTLRAGTLELLRRFLASGGSVLSVGQLPRRVDGSVSPEPAAILGHVPQVRNKAADLAEVLDVVAPAGAWLDPSDGSDTARLWLHTRVVDERTIHVVTNTARKVTLAANLVVDHPAELETWDPASGRVSPRAAEHAGGKTRTRLRLEPGETRVIVAVPAATVPAGTTAPTLLSEAAIRSIPLAGPYQVHAEGPNALPLDFCRYRTTERDWSEPLPVIAVQETLAGEHYRGRVWLRYELRLAEPLNDLSMVVEDAEEYLVTLNGSPLRPAGRPPYLDDSFTVLDALHAARPGDNVLELSREIEPPSEPSFHLGSLFHTSSDSELEAAYAIGDFSVRCRSSDGPAGCRRLSPGFSLAQPEPTSTGDLVADGLPFYAGSITLETTVSHEPLEGEHAFLVLRELDAVLVRAAVNGRPAGVIAWRPYELDLTEHLRKGANTVTLTLVSSLRNLLGPHHRPSGEPDQVWSDGWTGLSGEGRRDTALRAGAGWATRRADKEVFWTDDYLVPAFGVARGCFIESRRTSLS